MRLPEPFFAWGEHIAIDLAGGRALFTTRRGGCSSGPYATLNLGRFTDDDPDVVAQNRARLARFAGLASKRIAQGRQVHETRVRRIYDPPAPASELEEADGQATALGGVAPLVLTADCLPIALVAPEAVAMIHAGWRGLAAGIVAEGARALRELGARGPVAAAVGPGAGPCCYEVGDEVAAAFRGADDSGVVRAGRLDLPLVARRRLEAAGMDSVHDVGLCTICSDPAVFFSHRRDAGVTGRQAGVVWRT